MSCLCPFCANYDDFHCQGRGPVHSCPFYAERQSAPRANPEGALPGPESAFSGPDEVIGDEPIIAQKEGKSNGEDDTARILGSHPGKHPL